MRNERKYTTEQVINFSKNFSFICDECMLSKFDITDIESPKQCFSENTYRKIRHYHTTGKEKYKNWCPHDGCIKAFVDMCRKYYLPSISINDIMNKDLSNIKFTPKEDFSTMEWYLGIYFCYYINLQNDITFGLLKVDYSTNYRYVCEAIMGVNIDVFFDVLLKKYTYNQIIENDIPLKAIYDNLTTETTDISSVDKTFYYYSGNISMFSESILINLNSNENIFARALTFNRYDRYADKNKPHCLGGIANMMTTSYAKKGVKFQKIILSRYNIYNINHLKLIIDSLSIDEIKSNVVLNNDNKNQQIYELIRKYSCN